MKKCITNEYGKEARKVRYFDAFAGIGISHLSLRDISKKLNLEIECVGYSEIDPIACECYEKLHGDIPYYGDVTKIDWSKIDVDMLSWTSPCQSVSSAGTRAGLKEGDDAKSSIIWEIKKALKEMPHKPRTIFVENVEGILSPQNKPHFDEFISYLESEGYHVSYKKIDASKVGFPQHRVRVYLFATYDKDLHFNYPKERPLDFRLCDILEKDVDEKYIRNPILRPNNHMLDIAANNDNRRKMRIHNPSYCDVAYCITTRSGSRNDDNFIFMDDVSRDTHLTINKSNLVKYGMTLDELKKVGYRILTPSEVMTLMGLSKEEQTNFTHLKDMDVFRLMGNAIVRPVLTEIFDGYFSSLISNELL